MIHQRWKGRLSCNIWNALSSLITISMGFQIRYGHSESPHQVDWGGMNADAPLRSANATRARPSIFLFRRGIIFNFGYFLDLYDVARVVCGVCVLFECACVHLVVAHSSSFFKGPRIFALL